MEPTNVPAPTPTPAPPGDSSFRAGEPPIPPRPAARSPVLKYAISLVLLVAVIGGIAWVVQYLPSWNRRQKVDRDPPPPLTQLLQFPRWVALWDEQKPAAENKDGVPLGEKNLPREVEFGTPGHYDFPFKNLSGQDVEVLHYFSTCDCTSVRACVLPMAQVVKLVEQQKLKPGEDLTYDADPAWVDLPNHREPMDVKKGVTVKADEGGVVRVRWTVKKRPGEVMKIMPEIVMRPIGASEFSTWRKQMLVVPVLVGTAIRFDPPRVNVGLLSPGCKPVTEVFNAWSSTREKFDLKLTPTPANALMEIASRPLTEKECADLTSNLKSEKLSQRVRSGYRVTVTVHESKDGKQLDQGPFIQRLAIDLDGFREQELSGPEIVGRVKGDILIGGQDDWGKIKFLAFAAGQSAQKTVVLIADAKLELKPYTHEPAWLDVKVTRDKDQPDPKKHRWHLQVTVPANTPGVRSFEETDHVTLRIVGMPDRFVRIALEGALSGR